MTPKKIAFVDRDGVVNKKAAPHQYLTKVEDFQFTDGIFEMLTGLTRRGFELIIITNQRGIARGMLAEQDLGAIHAFMQDEFNQRGIKLLDIFYCPHEKDTCDCRKPKPGMLEQACAKYPIDLANSILISDSPGDTKMGEDFGVGHNYLVPCDEPKLVL